jgi:hypothetical protein
MNNKKLILIVLLLVKSICSFGQNSNTAYLLWYEYGDGNFNSNSFWDTLSLKSYVNNLPNANGSFSGLQKAVIVYPPNPPKKLSINVFAKRTGVKGFNVNGNNLTDLSEELQILPSTSDFIQADTMNFALHYNKKNYPNAKKVAFYYNSNGNATFKKVTNTAGEIGVIENRNGATTNIKQIRTHSGEMPSIANANQLNSTISTNGNNFQDAIVFNLPNNAMVQNLFVSLITEPTFETDDNEEFKLVFLDEGDNVLKETNSGIRNSGGLGSHDPNYEIVKPSCLKEADVTRTIAEYKVHFQNTGGGPATKVQTITALPTGYTVNDIVNWNPVNKSGLTTWRIGGVPINNNYSVTLKDSANGNILIVKFRRKPNLPAKVFPNDLARTPSEVLIGTNNMPDPLNDKRTTGEFEFKLKLKTPPTVPVNLVSFTNIIFDDNEPIMTDDATIRIRKCCKCNERNSNTDTNNTSDNSTKPCRWKSKFLQWLLCENC